MRKLTRLFLPLGAALVAVASAAGAAFAKCTPSLGHPVLPGYVFILDGRVMGEYRMEQQWEGPAKEDVYSVEVTCLDMPQADAPGARQAAVVVVTRSGFADTARRLLEQVAEAQRVYHGRHGRYAADLDELKLSVAGRSIPMQMVVHETAFAARITGPSLGMRCAVGLSPAELAAPTRDALELTARQARGIPECQRLEQ